MTAAKTIPIHNFRSPLRYPGGKGGLAKFMKMVVRDNELLDGHYAEVYAGGAAIAWSLIFAEYAQEVHINDLDSSVYAFWKSVFDSNDELCGLIDSTEVTMDEWHTQQSVQSDSTTCTLLELGFSTFFLNRTNRSGILKGGVIGGKEQSGKWKLDARYNKSDLITRITRLGRYRDRIHVYRMDAADFIKTEIPRLPSNTLVYLDPPYFCKGNGLYENHYDLEDHADIANLVTDIEQPWIVSYDASPVVQSLYSDFRRLEYKISYSAHRQYAGSEVMFFGSNVVMPNVTDPLRCK